MRKSLAGILLALLTTLGVLVAAATPAGAVPSKQKLRSGSAPILFNVTEENGKRGVAQFQPDSAAMNEAGNGLVLVGDMTYKGATQQDVAVPLTPVTTPTAAAPAAAAAAGPGECDVLNLVLGPLDLNLLGLEIHLDQVVLDIVADPSGGLLGQLLCALAGGPNGGPLAGLLNQIIDILNQILGGLGG